MRKYLLISSVWFLIGLDLLSKSFFQNLYFWKMCDQWDHALDIFAFCHTEKYIPILGNYLWFELANNTWVAFSLPLQWYLLQIITVIIIGFLIKYYIQVEYKKKSKLLDIGYAFIFSWALSHAYERIFHGYVVDFIAIKYFAILNFADIFISVGAFLIFCAYALSWKHR